MTLTAPRRGFLQLFDVATSKEGRPLGRVANFIDAHGEGDAGLSSAYIG